VSGKGTGLGDEAQIHVVLSATALCINDGGNHPKAVNRTDVIAAGDFPVQNGKADFPLSVTASFQPSCSPPMTVSFTIMVSDSTSIRDASLIGGNPHEAARNSAPAQASNVVATFTGLALRHKFETTTSREIT
jgi:hypothetical protein